MLARIAKVSFAGLVVLIVVSLVSAAAAANTVPPSFVSDVNHPVELNQFVPPECEHLSLTRIQLGGGGGGGSALILGSASPGTLSGGGGDDCIIGGSGNTTLQGQGGNDVLIGGPVLLVILNGGGGTDTCYRGAALIALPSSCEAYIP